MKTYEVVCVRCQKTKWPYCAEPPLEYVCALCTSHSWKALRKTPKQGVIFKRFTELVWPFRVLADLEGFPYIPGKLGRIEFHDREKDELAVYTESSHTRMRLIKIPGIIRHQMGSDEFRFRFSLSVLPKVADVIRARKRRLMSGGRRFKAKAHRA